jgi:hypothetical protein
MGRNEEEKGQKEVNMEVEEGAECTPRHLRCWLVVNVVVLLYPSERRAQWCIISIASNQLFFCGVKRRRGVKAKGLEV